MTRRFRFEWMGDVSASMVPRSCLGRHASTWSGRALTLAIAGESRRVLSGGADSSWSSVPRANSVRSARARVQTGAAGAVGFERQIPALECQRAARIEAQQLQTG